MSAVEMSASIGAMIVHAAAARGADASALQKATGFDVEAARDPDARIPLALEEALWDAAAELCDDDAFGLHAAELMKPGAFDVMDYAVRTAPTVRAALARLIRYNRLVHNAAVFSAHERGTIVRIEHALRVGGAVQCRHSAEFTMASLVIMTQQLVHEPVTALAAEFRHAAPRSAHALAEHTRLFGIAPRFSCSVNAVELDRTWLDRAVVLADPALSRVVERHAEALLARVPDPLDSTTERVRRLLVVTLGQGDATLAAIARTLHTSERSLQRRLATEGTSFDKVLDELRRELALRYLADPKLAIGEVAYLVGFSESSPFHRAFKRWTGKTPSEARGA